jgi:hypothetical protein
MFFFKLESVKKVDVKGWIGVSILAICLIKLLSIVPSLFGFNFHDILFVQHVSESHPNEIITFSAYLYSQLVH